MGRLIDETGNRYGRLVVIERSRNDKFGQAMWLCKCTCGNDIIVLGGNLRRERTRSCGCSWRKDETGSRHGRLIVIARSENNKFGHAMWLCKCDCGNETFVSGANLRRSTKSCGCLAKERAREICKARRLPFGEAAFNALFRRIKRNADTRNLEWSLTSDQVRALSKQSCYYCGIKPQQVISVSRYGSYVYNGLDRIDNSRGYTINNVVPCCGICNVAKNAQTTKQFREWLVRIHGHFIEESK